MVSDTYTFEVTDVNYFDGKKQIVLQVQLLLKKGKNKNKKKKKNGSKMSITLIN